MRKDGVEDRGWLGCRDWRGGAGDEEEQKGKRERYRKRGQHVGIGFAWDFHFATRNSCLGADVVDGRDDVPFPREITLRYKSQSRVEQLERKLLSYSLFYVPSSVDDLPFDGLALHVPILLALEMCCIEFIHSAIHITGFSCNSIYLDLRNLFYFFIFELLNSGLWAIQNY